MQRSVDCEESGPSENILSIVPHLCLMKQSKKGHGNILKYCSTKSPLCDWFSKLHKEDLSNDYVNRHANMEGENLKGSHS